MGSPSPADGKDGDAGNGEWRASVPQSYRSTEVREIATVLASLEPGATSSSKLMLAMRFEDTIFNTAESLADYRKKLTKRLKKLQKSYVPTATAATQASKQQQRVLALRQKYADTLRFVVRNADKAVSTMKAKHGEERAYHLKQHTDSARQWHDELLGSNVSSKPMDETKLNKIQQVLEQRLDNIRSHVIKMTDPDTFLKESLEHLEQNMDGSASKILASATSRRLSRVGWTEFADSGQALVQSLEKAQAPIPLPTRNQNTDREAATLYLEKMRAASQAVLAFTAVPDKAAPGLPQNVLAKSHDAIMQGLDSVGDVAPKLRNEQDPGTKVTLEDAWTKILELPPDDGNSFDFHSTKRLKTKHASPVIKSRMLLTPGRNPPSNLLPALKQKEARLVKAASNGFGAHLEMEFGQAFVMNVYLVPLTVTLRATTPENNTSFSNASWTPACGGLAHLPELQIFGVKGSPKLLGGVVEQYLRFASAQATHVLRQCFRMTLKTSNKYEIEVLEATALLHFLQLCRDTYLPKSQDEQPII